MAKDMGIVERVQRTIDRVRDFGEGGRTGYITPDSAIKDTRDAIAEAKSVGASVFDLESKMPEIEQKAWRFAAKKA
jgi:hypothetical protein